MTQARDTDIQEKAITLGYVMASNNSGLLMTPRQQLVCEQSDTQDISIHVLFGIYT